MTPLLLALLAFVPQQETAGDAGLYLQGSTERPRGYVQVPQVRELLRQMGDTKLDNDRRMGMLGQLAYHADRQLPYDQIRRMKRHVGKAALPDYIRCLGMCGEQGLEELRQYAKRKTPEVRAEVVYALGRYSADGESYARGVLVNPKEPAFAQVAALRSLADRGSDFAHVEALRRLSMATGPLLLEALAVIRRDPSDDDIDALIDLLARDDGRPGREATALLQRITGYNIGPDSRRWRHFFLRHKVEETPFRAETEGERNSAATLSYMGLPIYGNRLVFVLDSSGSMNDPLPEQPQFSRGRAAVGEFTALLPRLRGDAAFNVVFFADFVSAWAEEPEPQGPESVRSAKSWTEARTFNGGTNLYGGLEFAFEDGGVDEIVLLSDGLPTNGELTMPSDILARVARWNRWRQVRISTVSFGAPLRARLFLYELAKENGGACRIID